ncbi:hypothetical protein CH254_24070 [Rhodococcus sp. 06-412-2C]|uniref:MFS transporter n=1 Tax=unclassified Rhodococcus (in: high G+C Gram-positive bacteria) TaxID=192944 RepID=UPI000B9BE40F|nr:MULTISPECIES: MFS transporter [unclassified Rhodococcus (in: high G+C Gram-positive bacteria)]OZC83964.1 hypothetical protein CH254_24070 [Rhodococcus sp. 06-412-2C]OZC94152.1 hypothetical protein CH279_22155 [Rhodococcus sp. 06-412-2B]
MTEATLNAPSLNEGRARVIVGVIAFAGLMGTLMQSLIVPILGELPELLDASPTATSWLVTGMLLSGAVSNVLFGRLGDMYGTRRMIIVCLSFLVVGSVLGSVTTNIGLLIVARVLQGVTMAVIPLGVSALGDLLVGDRLVKGIALVSAMVGIGGSLGFAVAAAAAQVFPLPSLFAASAVLAVVALLGVVLFMPSIPASASARIDVLGVFGLTFGLVALLVAISEGSTRGWSSPTTLGLFGIAIVVLVLWGAHQLHHRDPLIDLRTAGRRAVLFTNLATIVVGFGMYGVILALPQLIQLPTETGFGLGQPVIVAGLVVAPGAVASLLVPSLAARVTTRGGPKVTMTVGALSMAIGYVALIFAHSEIWQMIVAGILISVGVSFCFGAAPTLIMRNVSHAETGQANGLNNLARSLGTSSSSAITAAVLASLTITAGYGAEQVPAESAFVTVFFISAVASLLICILVFFATGKEAASSTRTPA